MSLNPVQAFVLDEAVHALVKRCLDYIQTDMVKAYINRVGMLDMFSDLDPSYDSLGFELMLDSIDDVITEHLKAHHLGQAGKYLMHIKGHPELEVYYTPSSWGPHKHKVFWKPSEHVLCVLK